MKSFSTTLIALLATLALAANGCSSDPSALEEEPGGGEDVPPGGGGDADAAPADDPTKDYGTSYTGFGEVVLDGSRLDEPKGSNRSRMKPFSALQTEYTRVLGNKPAALDGAAATFGRPPANWFIEPSASAISLVTAYSVGFDGCLTYVDTKPELAQAPTEASADAECKTMTRKFWSREATAEELGACKAMALTDSAPEAAPKRRWAYTCASVLTASGFLAY